MASESETFYGDMAHHSPVAVTFGAFLDAAASTPASPTAAEARNEHREVLICFFVFFGVFYRGGALNTERCSSRA
jgi:hypothetical protein